MSVMALKNVKVSLTERSIVAIVGPTGAGKSTLHSLLSTSLRRTTGDLVILGESEKYKSVIN
jgi:ABC-type sugar transport system ATPase subunit